jgi:hypothetical protein
MTAKSKWCVIGIGIAIFVAWFALGPFLRGLAAFLVADESVGSFQYIAVLDWYNGPDGDRCYDAATNLYQKVPSRRILLVESSSTRLVEIGALEAFDILSRRELENRGLPANAVTAIHSDGRDDWATARAIRVWLTDRPGVSALLLCGRFRSATVRHVLDEALGPTLAGRVRVRGLPDRRFDESNWWTTRTGIKAFGTGWCRRIHGWYASQDYRPPPFCNADDYERKVRRSLTGATP